MSGAYGDRKDPSAGVPQTEGRRSRMPLYLTTFLVVVVALERLIDHVLA